MKSVVIVVILLAIPSMLVSETLDEALSRARAYNQAKQAEREAVTDADTAYSKASEAIKRSDLDGAERWAARLRQIDDKDPRLKTIANRIADARKPLPAYKPAEPVVSILDLGRPNRGEEIRRRWIGISNNRVVVRQEAARPGRGRS